MTGFQEILIIICIVLGIFFIPRMMPKKNVPRPVALRRALSGKMRMAIAISVLYPLLCAAFIRPWQKDPVLFVYVGIVPVAMGWVAAWVFTGFRKH